MLVPAHNTNTSVVSVHAAKLLALLHIPNLDLTSSETNADVSTVTAPLDTGDGGVLTALQERVDGAGLGRPNVDIALETDSDLVARAPVEEVEVVVVSQTRSIKDTLRRGQDTTAELRGRCCGGLERTVVLRAEINWLG